MVEMAVEHQCILEQSLRDMAHKKIYEPLSVYALFRRDAMNRIPPQGFSKVAVEIKAPRPGPRQDEKRSGDVGERRWGCDANPSRRAPRC